MWKWLKDFWVKIFSEPHRTGMCPVCDEQVSITKKGGNFIIELHFEDGSSYLRCGGSSEEPVEGTVSLKGR
ncbi:MAG: hypothetical protein WCT37_00995 [Patescibacteria group bacterium]|jgi:hypothetical protein